MKCAIAVTSENEEGEKEIVYLSAGVGETMSEALTDAIKDVDDSLQLSTNKGD
jgi:hypothetical protein